MTTSPTRRTLPGVAQGSIRARATWRLVRVVEARGLGSAELLAAAGVAPLPDDPNERVPIGAHLALWGAAMRRLADPGLPVEVGRAVAPSDFDVVGYAARSAPSLGRALEVMVRYGKLHTDDNVFELESAPGGQKLAFRPSGPLPLGARAATENVLVQVVHMARDLVGVPFRPLEVTFRHPAPARTDAHELFFGLPPRFGRERASILFALEDLDRPLAGADPGLHQVLTRLAEAALAALPPQASFTAAARRVVARSLAAGPPSLEGLSRQLHCSPRTARRRLEEEGTSFREVLDEVRRELALRYLREDRFSGDEVACLLGFSDARAFRRAFRRWTGRAPAEQRAVEVD